MSPWRLHAARRGFLNAAPFRELCAACAHQKGNHAASVPHPCLTCDCARYAYPQAAKYRARSSDADPGRAGTPGPKVRPEGPPKGGARSKTSVWVRPVCGCGYCARELGILREPFRLPRRARLPHVLAVWMTGLCPGRSSWPMLAETPANDRRPF